ncbi:hypothetical protein ACTXT7_016132 [Hymenolepis weldensis]
MVSRSLSYLSNVSINATTFELNLASYQPEVAPLKSATTGTIINSLLQILYTIVRLSATSDASETSEKIQDGSKFMD